MSNRTRFSGASIILRVPSIYCIFGKCNNMSLACSNITGTSLAPKVLLNDISSLTQLLVSDALETKAIIHPFLEVLII